MINDGDLSHRTGAAEELRALIDPSLLLPYGDLVALLVDLDDTRTFMGAQGLDEAALIAVARSLVPASPGPQRLTTSS